MYPGATPEFRVLVTKEGTQQLQVRYINITQGYTSKWQDVETVYEQELVE